MILLMGDREDDPLFLQIKEANASVLAPYAGASEYEHQGERVVHGQRLMQAASDAFLGWVTGTGERRREFYVRQLRDMKGSAAVETMPPARLALYGELCGATLARAHARTGDAAKITGYLGDDDTFERALERFAVAYADQNDADYAAFTKAGGGPPHRGRTRRLECRTCFRGPRDAPGLGRLESGRPPRRPWTVGVEEEVMLVAPGAWAPVYEARRRPARALEPRARRAGLGPRCTAPRSSSAHGGPRGRAVSRGGGSSRHAAPRGLPRAPSHGADLRTGERRRRTPFAPVGRHRALGRERGTRRSTARCASWRAASPPSACTSTWALPDADDALHACSTRLRGHIPLFLALSANSPFWQGRDTGPGFGPHPRSSRAFPRVGHSPSPSPPFERVDPRRGRCWWTTTPSPSPPSSGGTSGPSRSFGTVEVRIMDAQITPRGPPRALAALVQAIVELREGGMEWPGHARGGCPRCSRRTASSRRATACGAEVVVPTRATAAVPARGAARAARGHPRARTPRTWAARAELDRGRRAGRRPGRPSASGRSPASARATRRGPALATLVRALAADFTAARRGHVALV